MKKDNNNNCVKNPNKGPKSRFKKESDALKANLEKRKLQIKMRNAQKSPESED